MRCFVPTGYPHFSRIADISLIKGSISLVLIYNKTFYGFGKKKLAEVEVALFIQIYTDIFFDLSALELLRNIGGQTVD